MLPSGELGGDLAKTEGCQLRLSGTPGRRGRRRDRLKREKEIREGERSGESREREEGKGRRRKEKNLRMERGGKRKEEVELEGKEGCGRDKWGCKRDSLPQAGNAHPENVKMPSP